MTNSSFSCMVVVGVRLQSVAPSLKDGWKSSGAEGFLSKALCSSIAKTSERSTAYQLRLILNEADK